MNKLKNQKIFYKVVCDSNKFHMFCAITTKLTSVVSSLITYHQNIWTYPDISNSKLFVFNNRKNAENFLLGLTCSWTFSIYKVEVINPAYLKYMCIPIAGNFKQMWKLKHNKKKFIHLTTKPPKGTVGVDAVKLIERI